MHKVPWAILQRMLLDSPTVDESAAQQGANAENKDKTELPAVLTAENAAGVMDTLNALFQ